MPPLIFSHPNEQRIRDGDTVFSSTSGPTARGSFPRRFCSKDFDGFDREVWPQVNYVTLTQYDVTYPSPFIFCSGGVANILGEVVSARGQDTAADRRDGKISTRHLFF